MKYSTYIWLFLLYLINSPKIFGQVTINEFLASNITNISDPEFREYSDWIELYNDGSSSINLSGWGLKDNAGSGSIWKFPDNTIIMSKGYLIIWADGRNTGLHTDFKLSADGENVALYDTKGVEIDLIVFGSQSADISYGRKSDGSSELGFFTSPTPGKSNTLSSFYSNITSQVPVFVLRGGFYPQAVQVEIKNLYKSGILRFTTDGSDPSETSEIYTSPLNIQTSTVVKARMFYPNFIPGPVITNSYFINEHFEDRKLPVISLSTNPDYFYGRDSGLYVQNFKPLWEYPIHLEFYQKDGILGFHHDAGVQIGGLNAWILPQKLLNIYSRKKYGSKQLDFQLFNHNSRNRFGDMILRCSGNDWSNTFFRDGMMQSLIKDYADLDGQDFRPCIVYFNGKYLGLHNIREKQDEDYCEYYYGIKPDSLDYIENNTEIKDGNLDLYNQMVQKLNNGVQTNVAFQSLDSIMDVRNYTDYIISQIFTANTSWGHNISCFRDRSSKGKWRWLLHDYDRGFDLANVNGTAMSWATATNGQDYSNPPWATLFLRKMLENDVYKQHFIRLFADHLYVTFHPETIRKKVEYHAQLIENEMPSQIARWLGTKSSYGNAIPSFAYWQNEVENLKQFGISRNAFMWNDLNSFFSLNGITTLRLDVSNSKYGYIRLNEFKIPSYPWSGSYLQKRNITLTAFENPGYKFDHWERIEYTNTYLLTSKSSWKYFAAASSPESNWNEANYNDNSWSSGNAELGYGDGDENTVIGYGSDPNNKYPSYYFRSNFMVKDLSKIGEVQLRFKIDDGAVVYVNGNEIARYNMIPYPSKVAYDSLALSSISGTAENDYHAYSIPMDKLLQGRNVIAVEVHQNSRSSSDISFDAEIIASEVGKISTVGQIAQLSYVLDSSAANLRAVFLPNGTCGILPDTIFTQTKLTKLCSPYKAFGDVVVLENTLLNIEEGVEIQFPEKANLLVYGKIVCNGTSKNPVLFTSTDHQTSWGGIFLQNPSDTSIFQYSVISNASSGLDRTYFPAAISCYHANVVMDHLTITDVEDNPIFCRFSNVKLTNSDLRSKVTGDCINVKQGYGVVENCSFTGGNKPDMDGVDFDGVQNGIIRNNTIHDFKGDNNDGLDIGEGCENLIIENNFIYHCLDKGISIGQESSAEILNNTIAYTTIGIALKDESKVNIEHCTLFGNQQGISAYEKNPGFLGGNGMINNCIVSNASKDAYIADNYSSLKNSNCLSDLDSMGNTQGDLIANPYFINPTMYDFHLGSNSSARGAGSDGMDLGCLSLPVYKGQVQIMISEILYDDSLSNYPEFIEIYNPGAQTIDLSGYTFSNAIDYIIPNSVSIKANEALIVTKDKTKFTGTAFQVLEWTDGKLNNAGEEIDLYDQDGLLIDFVRYDNTLPWPESNNLQGRSIELRAVHLDNHFGTSWKASDHQNGTPGQVDIVNSNQNNAANHYALYPNPAYEKIIITSENNQEIRHIKFYDELGKELKITYLSLGSEKYSLDIHEMKSGIYFVDIEDMNGRHTYQKVQFMK